MGSKKTSAKARARAAFEAELGTGSQGLDAAFASAATQRNRMDAEHEERLRHKACERKKRYPTRADAESAIRDCKRHGSRDLHCYQCTSPTRARNRARRAEHPSLLAERPPLYRGHLRAATAQLVLV